MTPNADDALCPPHEPHWSGWLDVGDGHRLWVEDCGRRDGVPVVFLHGGPGSGCNAAQRRLFDPEIFRAILIDQRGAGRSLPLGELRQNTTQTLIADLERVRGHFGWPQWLVYGGSWGSLLALAYAQTHPDAISGLVLRGIFLGSAAELNAYARQAARAYPAAWAAAGAPDGVPFDAFAASILDRGDAETAQQQAWLNHERALMGEPPLTAAPTPAQIAKVRIQMHYLRAGCFVEPGQLLDGVPSIRHVPAVIIQGLADPVCPPATAQQLHMRWPEAAWIELPGAGHGGLEPAIAAATRIALKRLAAR